MTKLDLDALFTLGEEVVGGVETFDKELGAFCRTLPDCFGPGGMV